MNKIIRNESRTVVCVVLFALFLSIIIPGAWGIEYGYDDLNRLTWVKHPDGTTVEYVYDAVGNRTRKLVTIAENPVLEITNPTSSVQWRAGDIYTVEWTYSEKANPYFRIELYQGDILSAVIDDMAPNTGSYDWTVSPEQPIGMDYRIKLISVTNTDLYKYSEYFSIIVSDGEGGVEGDIEGGVEGNVEGGVEGDIEGGVEGDIEGGVEGDIEGGVEGDMEGGGEGENPLVITQQPQDASVYVGNSHTFSIVASGGVGSLTYDWEKNGTSLGGPSLPTFTIVSVSLANAGVYSCSVSDGVATVESDGAELLVYEPAVTGQHNADQDNDWLINLSELLRIIQFYNSDGFHCEAGTEDGFAPGPGDTSCVPHDSDYNAQDWQINLSELLRVIQFFNSRGYHCEEGTEDNFAPGAGTACEGEGEGEGDEEGVPSEGSPEEGQPEGVVEGEGGVEGDDEGANEGQIEGEGEGDEEGMPSEGSPEEGQPEGMIEGEGELQAGDMADFAGITFVWCPPGSFSMGDESKVDPDESPKHTVTFSQGFWMSKYEVTQAQWTAVMGSNPSYFQDDDRPVETVSWSQIVEPDGYLEKLNEANPGMGFRLPTEAEWEYACRADTTAPYYWGDEPTSGDYGWYAANSAEGEVLQTHAVGGKLPNDWGLHDMSGNVWEWVQDWYHSNYIGAPSDGSAFEGEVSANRVIRGGGFGSVVSSMRSANRDCDNPASVADSHGFRLVR
ncbi:MAG TPA: SUMF1/EgtB/PvdO family nonheme iron enzyme [Candidatus Hydrogenedentes bacterium]|nr:SUMF1/EgtB/PvdO family nonheme iron enzyme [Candidatus Hydrogenedentota bacterium]